MTLKEKTELADYLIRKNAESTVQDLTDAIREREQLEKSFGMEQKILAISPRHLKQAK